MAPNITSQALLLAAGEEIASRKEDSSGDHAFAGVKSGDSSLQQQYEWKISWRNVLAFVYLHAASFYAIYLMFAGRMGLKTVAWSLFVGIISAFGVTAGAHRLWAHKAYKAKWQLRLILAFLQTVAFQNHIYEWVRDHRVHHKYTDTNADPHNINRGFFFSHMGWLMIRKHPDVKTKGKNVDMSDLLEDPIVVWQKRTYLLLMPLLCFILPTCVPYYYWGESIWNAWYCTIFRYTLSLHGTWLVNSAAHIWGTKPYDTNISSTENTTVGVLALGEGWHNYHHVFPWDYKAAELGNYSVNMTTGIIDVFAKIGWAYDLRTVSPDVIRKRAERTGDGTLKDPADPRHHMNNVWGWGDRDMTEEDMKMAVIQNPRRESHLKVS